MAVSASRIRSFIRLCNASDSCSYNEANKAQFHRDSKAILKEVANLMGLKKGEYDLRSNQGGIAVSGEITLHTDGVYLQFSQFTPDLQILYRSCKGRKDYSGGGNQWARWSELEDLPAFAEKIKRVHDRSLQAA